MVLIIIASEDDTPQPSTEEIAGGAKNPISHSIRIETTIHQIDMNGAIQANASRWRKKQINDTEDWSAKMFRSNVKRVLQGSQICHKVMEIPNVLQQRGK